MQSFQFVGLDHTQFEHLFLLSDKQLREISVQRNFASSNPGFPCRISLEDAEVGDELLLLNHVHHLAASPYKASGPIFVRRGVKQRTLPVNTLPDYLALPTRLTSARGYDAEGFLVEAEVCERADVANLIDQQFSNKLVSYIHLHNARRGCFTCQVNRA